MEAATTEPRRIGPAAGRLDREAARARASHLFVEHGELVRRVCVGLLRDRYEAEDAAQQAFLSAYRALADGTDPREPAAWLATIARNECLLRIRSRMRAPIATPLEEEAAPDDVHRQAVSRSHAAKLWREIHSLPQQQRDVVILREFAGLSYDELAVALGISKPAVESLLFRARGRLRTRLEAAFASLNLAGAASTIADAAARIVGSGAAQPAAAKIVAAGAAAALVGGGTAVVTDHVVPSGHHAAARRAPVHVVSRSAAAPPPASLPVLAIAAQPRRVPQLAAADARRGGHGREDGAARGHDGREHADGESRVGAVSTESRGGDARDGGGERVTTGDRSGDGGGEHGDGAPATTTSVRVDGGGESGDGRDGGREGGDSARTTTNGETAPAPTTTSSSTTSEDAPPPPPTSSDGGTTVAAPTIPLTTTTAPAPLTTTGTGGIDGSGSSGSGSGSDG